MENLLTVQEAADLLKVSNTTVYRLTEGKLLPHTRIGNAIRIAVADIEEYLARNRVEYTRPVAKSRQRRTLKHI